MAVNRGQLTLPEGWQVTRNARVQVLPLQVEGARLGVAGKLPDAWQPLGTWRVIDRAPDTRGANSWWLQPADDCAKGWARAHRADCTQGCVNVPGRLVVPAGLLAADGELAS